MQTSHLCMVGWGVGSEALLAAVLTANMPFVNHFCLVRLLCTIVC
jgi:hypothetical protein